jgi:hypothetical protein
MIRTEACSLLRVWPGVRRAGRFATTLDCADISFLADGTLDELPLSSRLGATRAGRHRPSAPSCRNPAHWTGIDRGCENLRAGVQVFFHDLGIGVSAGAA